MMKLLFFATLLVFSLSAQARHHDHDGNYRNSGQISIGSDGIQFNIGPNYRERGHTYRRCWQHHGRTICKDYYSDDSYRHRRHHNYDGDYDRW